MGRRTAPARLHLKLIGRFELTTAGGGRVPIRSRRGRALLGYLHLQPERLDTRVRLAGLLWSDRGEPQARASLRQCLSELRNALPGDADDYVQVGRENVCLASSAFSSDTQAIEEALDQGRPETLAPLLLRTPTTPLMDDLDLGGLFADWLAQTREQFERRLASGVHGLLQRQAALGAWPLVRDLADALLSRQPGDEIAATAGMRAEIALGDASAARQRYRSLSAALTRDFGVEPGAQARRTLEAASAVSSSAEPSSRPEPVVRIDMPADPAAGPPLVMVAALDTTGLSLDDRHLGGAVHDEVLAGLTRFRDLRVTPTSLGLSDLNRRDRLQHDAAYILGGSVTRGPRGVRLTSQLIRTVDHTVIWSQGVDAAEVSVAATVERIIAKVLGAVSPSIEADLARRALPRPDTVYQRYLSASRAAATSSGHQAARRAATDLEALIQQDPDFSLAYLPLARLYNTDFGYTRAGSSGAAERARAFELGKSALALDRGHIYAYTLVGWCYLWRRNWDAARAHFDHAVKLNPFHADRLMDAGFGYLCMGEMDQAASLFDRGLPLSPTPKDSYYTDLAMLEMMRGHHARAAGHLDFIARPSTWDILYQAVNAVLAGRPDTDLDAAAQARVRAIWPEETPLSADLVSAWVSDHHPLADPVFAGRFLEAARQVLAPGGTTPAGV